MPKSRDDMTDAEWREVVAEQEAAEKELAEKADRYLAQIEAAKAEGYERAKSELEAKFKKELEAQLAAREPPPDPLERLPRAILNFVDELRRRVEAMEGDISLGDFERVMVEREKNAIWMKAVERLLSIGVTCHGSFADGDIVLRSEWSGLVHRVRMDEFGSPRLLMIAGPHGWLALRPLTDNNEQLREVQQDCMAAIAVIAGATLLPGDFESYMREQDRPSGTAKPPASAAA